MGARDRGFVEGLQGLLSYLFGSGVTHALCVIQDMYAAVRANAIYQPSASTLNLPESRPSTSLSPSSSPYANWGSVARTGSRRSQVSATSDGSNAFKRSSIRGLLGVQQNDLGRAVSPTPSAATSFSELQPSSTAFASSVRTTPSSVFSHTATLGFAGNLSHTIIREQQEDDAQSEGGASVADEELALLGPPWAKEGLLHRKHYWDAPGKRSKGKDKEWLEVFVVIQKGDMKMFKFGDASSGVRGGRVGGGNWLVSEQHSAASSNI